MLEAQHLVSSLLLWPNFKLLLVRLQREIASSCGGLKRLQCDPPSAGFVYRLISKMFSISFPFSALTVVWDTRHDCTTRSVTLLHIPGLQLQQTVDSAFIYNEPQALILTLGWSYVVSFCAECSCNRWHIKTKIYLCFKMLCLGVLC